MGRPLERAPDMPNAKGHERMLELTASIERALRDMEAGRLDAQGLERCTEEARSLYERLVVLRHKLREAAAHAPPPPVATAPPMRLDTRPPEATRQTSLIDAIAETEAPPPPKAKAPKATAAPPPAAPKTTVADRLEQAPVADLHKAIALSQKFWFVAELFQGQRERYEKAIDAINAFQGLDEAKAFIDSDVLGVLPKPPGEDVLTTFLELVQRRFR